MATQKRRIVYLSDDDWEEIKELARGMSMSISGYLRAMISGSLDQPHVRPKMTLTLTQTERDAILRKINKGE
jgi:hypothetical protein